VDPDAVAIHHVSLPVSDLERSKRFCGEVLGLREIERPPFDFPGAWFAVGSGGNQLHLIVSEGSTFREGKGVDSRDIHFALRVPSYHRARVELEAKGYSTEKDPHDLLALKASPHATAGFPQLYILDPDRNVIEINAESLDSE
jgi:glyoxylase I family protein